jgi:ankyrin repeat protein
LSNNPKLNSRNNGRTPLYIACVKNNYEIVKALIETPGVDPNIPDNSGCTPLYVSAELGFTNIVKYLIENSERLNIEVNKKANNNLTPYGNIKSMFMKLG